MKRGLIAVVLLVAACTNEFVIPRAPIAGDDDWARTEILLVGRADSPMPDRKFALSVGDDLPPFDRADVDHVAIAQLSSTLEELDIPFGEVELANGDFPTSARMFQLDLDAERPEWFEGNQWLQAVRLPEPNRDACWDAGRCRYDGACGACPETSIVAPEPVADFEMTCPQGWTSFTVPGANGCTPWPNRAPPPCPAGAPARLGDETCTPIGDVCPPAGSWAPASGPRLYVSVTGDDGGDGSMTRPFRTLGRAIEESVDGTTILLGTGDFGGGGVVITRPIEIVGSCLATRIVQPVDLLASAGFRNLTLNGDVFVAAQTAASMTELALNGPSLLTVDGAVNLSEAEARSGARIAVGRTGALTVDSVAFRESVHGAIQLQGSAMASVRNSYFDGVDHVVQMHDQSMLTVETTAVYRGYTAFRLSGETHLEVRTIHSAGVDVLFSMGSPNANLLVSDLTVEGPGGHIFMGYVDQARFDSVVAIGGATEGPMFSLLAGSVVVFGAVFLRPEHGILSADAWSDNVIAHFRDVRVLDVDTDDFLFDFRGPVFGGGWLTTLELNRIHVADAPAIARVDGGAAVITDLVAEDSSMGGCASASGLDLSGHALVMERAQIVVRRGSAISSRALTTPPRASMRISDLVVDRPFNRACQIGAAIEVENQIRTVFDSFLVRHEKGVAVRLTNFDTTLRLGRIVDSDVGLSVDREFDLDEELRSVRFEGNRSSVEHDPSN